MQPRPHTQLIFVPAPYFSFYTSFKPSFSHSTILNQVILAQFIIVFFLHNITEYTVQLQYQDSSSLCDGGFTLSKNILGDIENLQEMVGWVGIATRG